MSRLSEIGEQDMDDGKNVRFSTKIHQPDILDCQIIRELSGPSSMQWNVKPSYADIAKRIGIDEETVRKRIKQMEETGVIAGWRVIIHPNVIGCAEVFVDLSVCDVNRKKDVIEQLRLLDGMIFILNFEGESLFLMLYSEARQELQRKLQLISAICQTKETASFSAIFPPCKMKLSPTDWRLVWAIRNNPRKRIKEIAKECAVTTRTINRRFKQLVENKALFLMGLPCFCQSGSVTSNLVIFCSGSDKKIISQRINAKFENIVFAPADMSSNDLFCNSIFHNVSEAEAACEWIKSLEGVTSVRMRIIKDLIFIPEWIDNQMKKYVEDNPKIPASDREIIFHQFTDIKK